MPEILTESFCERCGTRYTFEAARTRTRLKGVRVLSRGLKNFVLSDDTSMDEAMAAARSETEREVTANQLDAFHKTFNFCMSCRQYTCPNCWNEAEARCLSCAPHLGHEIMPAPFPDLPAAELMVADPFQLNGTTSGQDTHGADGFGVAGEESAYDVDVAARLASLTASPSAIEPSVAPAGRAPEADEAAMAAPVEVTPSSVVEEPAAETSAEAGGAEPARGPDLGDLAAAAIVVDAVNPEPSVAPKSTGRTGGRRGGFRPGQNLDMELDAYERERTTALALAAADAEVSAEPEVVADVAAEPEVAAEPALIAGPEIVAEPEIAATAEAGAEPEMVAEPELIAGPEIVAEPEIAAAAEAGAEPEMVAEPEMMAEAEVAAEPEIAAAAEVAAEREVATVAEVAAEPEMVAEPEMMAEAEVAAAADVETAPETAPVVDDVIEQPTWRMVAPDPTPDIVPVDPASIPAAATAEPTAEPQWPTHPEWPGSRPAVGLPFLGRPAAPQGGLESLWAESTRDIVAGPAMGRATTGVQPCVSCGLSLSATARFCRRCGTSQPR